MHIVRRIFSIPEKVHFEESVLNPNRKLCLEVALALDVTKYKNYNPINGLSVLITTKYLDIESYTKKVKLTSLVLRENKMIPTSWDNVSTNTITLDRFLISSDGYYLDIEKAITKFKLACIELCTLLMDSDTAIYGIHEHNLRMLTMMLINIRGVLNTLIDASKIKE
jgi:hypothetical protein